MCVCTSHVSAEGGGCLAGETGVEHSTPGTDVREAPSFPLSLGLGQP